MLKKKNLCYEYDTTMNKSLKDVFKTFPTITISTPNEGLLNWYPSEYFIQEGTSPVFCVGIASRARTNELILGASFLLQKLAIFDPAQNRIRFAMGDCTYDQDRVLTDIVNKTVGFYSVE